MLPRGASFVQIKSLLAFSLTYSEKRDREGVIDEGEERGDIRGWEREKRRQLIDLNCE